MTDPDLVAAVDRWLVAEVRTNWPNIAADCLDADERAKVAAWFATEMTRFERWRREQGSGGTAVPPEASRAEERPFRWGGSWYMTDGDRAIRVAPPLPAPKPGTHESDLRVFRNMIFDDFGDNEWHIARAWSQVSKVQA